MKIPPSLCSVPMYVVLTCLIAACTSTAITPTPETVSDHAQLRIENAGDIDIRDLVVRFPDPEAISGTIDLEFGDVPAGSTTEYKDVPSGVYRYAAYKYVVNGQVQDQPVIDWVGEVPLDGRKFTYRIDFDPTRDTLYERIKLLEVLVDVPEAQ